MNEFDKKDWETIGQLKEAVDNLNGAVKELKESIHIINKTMADTAQKYVSKEDYAEIKQKVDWLHGRAQWIGGAIAIILFVLNFLQNGGINSILK